MPILARVWAWCDCVSALLLDSMEKLRGGTLVAVGLNGPSQTAATPTGTPVDVELVGFCGASGMPHRRDCGRIPASRRPGGVTQPTSHERGQFRQTGEDRKMANCQSRDRDWYVGMVLAWSGSSSDPCRRTRRGDGCAARNRGTLASGMRRSGLPARTNGLWYGRSAWGLFAAEVTSTTLGRQDAMIPEFKNLIGAMGAI